jgi:hypothetical protein
MKFGTMSLLFSWQVGQRMKTDVFLLTCGDWTGTGGGEHPPRNTWRGYEHVIYWLFRIHWLLHTGGAVVEFQFWRSGTAANHQQVVSWTETHSLPGKEQEDEDEHRRYDYKDQVIQLIHQLYTSVPRPTRSCGGAPPGGGASDLFTMTVRHQGII